MAKIRYLLSSINVVNVLLALVLLTAAYFTFFRVPSVSVRQRKPAVKKTSAEQKPAEARKAAQDDKTPFPTDYMVIAEQNLFHPDRKIPEKKAEEKKAAALPKPDFVLDGTLITDDMKIAFMQDKKKPVNTPGRPNRQTPLKIGDSMSGYTLVEIAKDRVVMRRGEDKIEVNLTDPSKTREHISTGSGSAATSGARPGSRGNRTPAAAPGTRRVSPRQRRIQGSKSNSNSRHNRNLGAQIPRISNPVTRGTGGGLIGIGGR